MKPYQAHELAQLRFREAGQLLKRGPRSCGEAKRGLSARRCCRLRLSRSTASSSLTAANAGVRARPTGVSTAARLVRRAKLYGLSARCDGTPAGSQPLRSASCLPPLGRRGRIDRPVAAGTAATRRLADELSRVCAEDHNLFAAVRGCPSGISSRHTAATQVR
jgi:hypothetical protein